MDELIDAVRIAIYGGIRIEPVPHRMYDWRIEGQSIDETADAVVAILQAREATLISEMQKIAGLKSKDWHLGVIYARAVVEALATSDLAED